MRYLFYIALSFVAAVISFSFFISIALIIKKEYHFIAHQSAQQQNNAEYDKGFWHVFFHDPTAFFTGALFFATVILAMATVALIVITQRGIKDQSAAAVENSRTALQAAEAAIQAATAERAWLTFHRFITGDFLNGRINEKEVEKGIVFVIYFQNSGRSPAIIDSVEMGQSLFPFNHQDLPNQKKFQRSKNAIGIVGPGMEFFPEAFVFDDAESIRIMSMADKVLLYIKIHYRTIFDKGPKHTETTLVVHFRGGWMEENGVRKPAFVGGPAGPNNSIS